MKTGCWEETSIKQMWKKTNKSYIIISSLGCTSLQFAFTLQKISNSHYCCDVERAIIHIFSFVCILANCHYIITATRTYKGYFLLGFNNYIAHGSNQTEELGQWLNDVCQSVNSLVMSSVQIEQTPPALRRPVQHRENANKCGKLAGRRWAPLLYHQVRDVSRLPSQLGTVFRLPVAGGEECATAFKSGAVESHRDDHQQARHDGQGVSHTVG